MSIVLLTGATGFVGCHLIRRLVQDGNEVHVLVRSSSNLRLLQDVFPRIRAHSVELSDEQRVAGIVKAVRPEQVFHLAGATVVAGAASSPADLLAGNVLATVNLINACEAVDYRSLVTTGDSFEYTP